MLSGFDGSESVVQQETEGDFEGRFWFASPNRRPSVAMRSLDESELMAATAQVGTHLEVYSATYDKWMSGVVTELIDEDGESECALSSHLHTITTTTLCVDDLT